uniref:Zinc finger protein PLAG1 n=1 Tax=Pelodiscus sinensis TaxID=13735 RepID=K7G3Y7_PELSI|nr:zinc finger protein PLAGL1 isoform X1 [Pelodiscus sinensis]XP_025035384.1 zinc finger protein PLAGL1 isoform X1 [Pelodiscus sinensis]|eukprot:XP_006139384.1 zinc finger protein PLAGL1 isoform X1 [Pelodiscus sinensis]
MSMDLLWCEDCGKSLIGECKLHGPLIRVKDRVIPSQAHLTLPHYLTLRVLELRPGNQQILGVFAKKVIQKRTQFGPFVGKLSTKLTHYDDNRLVLQVLKDERKYFLDAPSEDCGNWMMFVRLARNQEEQTLVAYQYGGEVYFTTVKPIEPHTELKVWYAADYAKFMEASPVVKEESDICALSPVLTRECANAWICSNCSNVFGTFALLESHHCISKDKALLRSFRPANKLGPLKAKGKIKGKQRETGLDKSNAPYYKAISCSPSAKPTYASSGSVCGSIVTFVPTWRNGQSSLLTEREVEQPDSYHCQLCGKIFVSTEKLKVHSYGHTGERPYRCSQQGCTKAFISKYKLIRHMAIHSPQKSHHCGYCEKTFHRKDHLKNHLRTHDPNKMAFKCEECGKKYNTKLGYKRHLALHAATSGDLTCKVCFQAFGDTEVLLEHLRTHAGKPGSSTKEKKYKCDHCERYFYTRKDVQRHMVVHTGCKDFLCQFCAQRFGRKDHLTRHMKKTHPQELLKGTLQNGDLQNLSDRLSPFRVKEDASILSFPERASMQYGLLNTLEAEEYSSPHTHCQQSLQSTPPLEPSHLLRMSCVDSLSTNYCKPSPPLIPSNQNLKQHHRYGQNTLSCTLASLKNLPLKRNVKAHNVNLLEDLPLPAPHKINLEEASSGSTGDAGKYMMHKEPVTTVESVSMTDNLTHILGFWQFPQNDNQNNGGDITMAFSQEEASLKLNCLSQQQGTQLALDGVALNQLHHVPHFSSSTNSVALPHFHHAFR